MKKVLVLTLALILVCGVVVETVAQDNAIRSAFAITPDSNNREQDGLKGPVRRIRTESAKIIIKGGNPVEGPRVLRASHTYDTGGRKIDSVVHSSEVIGNSGNEEYRRDEKGNVVELIVRGTDGSSFIKETYQYQFDELGNWKKMVRSVAVYEDGKISYEPIEALYRTIAYYYGEAIDKLAANTPKPPATTSDVIETASSPPPAIRSESGNGSGNVNSAPSRGDSVPANITTASIDKPVRKTESTQPFSAPTERAPKVTAPSTAATEERGSNPNAPTSRVNVRFVSEDLLRSAAISLPQPEYPEPAELASVGGKVEVHVIVDESGKVTSARAMSGHQLLKEAAESAARSATFAREKLSNEPARVYGIINYDFVPPAPLTKVVDRPLEVANPGTPANSNASLSTPSAPSANLPSENVETAAETYESKPEDELGLKRTIQQNPNDVRAYIKLGLLYSVQKKHSDAVGVFKTAIRVRPSEVGPSTHFHLAYSYMSLRKYSDAVNSFKQALYIKRAEEAGTAENKASGFPVLEEIHYGLALAYNALTRYRDAIRELKEVVELNPKLAEAHYNLAIAYLAVRDRPAAEKQERVLRELNKGLADRIANQISMNELTLPPMCRDILCR